MTFNQNFSAVLLLVLSTNAAIVATNGSCNTEGLCQQGGAIDEYLMCASGKWHTMPSNGYSCMSGSLMPPETHARTSDSTGSTLGTVPTSSTIASIPNQIVSAIEKSAYSRVSDVITTYLSRPLATRTTTLSANQVSGTYAPTIDLYGIKSYVGNGKMASVYDAGSGSTFRCGGVKYPENGLYVAFWTQYEQSLQNDHGSQPAPVNCGDYIEFANPLTGKSAIALVLDRCQSCVGVGNDPNDPNIPINLVNGATVDFSRSLWNQIFDNASDNVYDILYSGKPLQGSA